jgi:hypothetical protein
MKTLTQLREGFDCNPGNAMKLGVTNHLTPVGNIITNVRNFFGSLLGIVVEPGEDGVSLKLHSSKFVNPNEVNKVLDTPAMGQSTVRSYICQQGLCNSKLIDLGMYYVAYFGPNDIRTAENPDKVAANTCGTLCACKEMLQYGLDEAEMESLDMGVVNEAAGFDDEELEDKTKEQLLKFIQGTDKVKCAQRLADLLADDLNLPEDYYFKGVKDADGNESIALRYKFQRRRPFGKEVTLSKTLVNIYNVGENAVWVEANLTRDLNHPEMNRIVDALIKLIGAQPTEDPCVFAIPADEIQNLKDEVKDNKNGEGEKKEEESLDKTPSSEQQISATLSQDNKAV